MRLLLFLSFVSIGFLNAGKAFLPLSYTLALIENRELTDGTFRIVSLRINDQPVGNVEYTISRSHRSFIHFLHVDKDHRTRKGYGKLLFYTALKDIVQAGSTKIELQRQPYDLGYTDDFVIRDNQLKLWYGAFGFKEKNDGTDYMQLVNPSLLRRVGVVSRFTDSEIKFNLEKF